MNIYLAGGISGNLNPAWREAAKLLEHEGRERAIEKAMQIFLAGGEGRHYIHDELLEAKKKEKRRRRICSSSWRGSLPGGTRADTMES